MGAHLLTSVLNTHSHSPSPTPAHEGLRIEQGRSGARRGQGYPNLCVQIPMFSSSLYIFSWFSNTPRSPPPRLCLTIAPGDQMGAPSRFSAVPEWGAPPGVRSWITDFSQYCLAECQKQGLLKHQAQDGFLHHTIY